MQCKNLLEKRNWIFLFFFLFFQIVTKTSAIAQTTVDLSLRGEVDIKTSTTGQTVRFTTYLKNQNTSGSGTNIVVEKKISEEVLSFISSTTSAGSFSYNASTGVGLWSVPSLAAGDSVRLDMLVRIDVPGVHYAISQVLSAVQPDPDSTPGNNNPEEDDIAMSCTSAPMEIYPDEEILFFVDPLYQIAGLTFTWTKNGIPITQNTTGVRLNSNGSLSIFEPGVFNYTGSLNSCDLFEHCPLIVTAGACVDRISIGTPAGICLGSSTTLTATATNNSAIQWFLTPTGGTPIGSSASGAPFSVSPTTTTVYYADYVTRPAGCNLERVSVAVVVNALPATPSCPPTKDICTGETLDLLTQILNRPSTPGGVFEWRTGILPTSALVPNPTAVGAGTYYLFERSTTGCYGNPSILVVTAKQCEFLIDLSVVKTSTVTTAAINDIIPFTVVVRNSGPDEATNVEVQDVLPSGFAFVSSNNFTASGNILTATIPVIPANASITLTYQVRVTSGGSQRNFVQVTKADQKDVDSTPGNGPQVVEDDDDQVTIVIQNPQMIADLSLTKTVNNSTPSLNGTVTYLITVRNSGPQTATGVVVRDSLPAGLSFMAAIGAESISISGNLIDMSIAPLAPNAERTIQLMATVTQPGTWINYAQVWRSDQPDPDSTPGNNSTTEDDDDTVSITVRQDCNAGQLLISCVNPFICPGESTIITAVGSCTGTIVWSNGATGSSITVSPATTTIYTAFCRISPTCQGPVSNSVTVVVSNPSPPFIQASQTTTCGPTPVILTATGCNGIIQWSNGALGSSIEVNPTVSTNYTAVCRIASCTSTASNRITITPASTPAPPTIVSDKASVCLGESARLTASACTGNVTWSNGATGTSIVVNPTTTTTYTAVCQVGVCASPASTVLTVQVQPLPTVAVSASATEVCSAQSVTLTATGCAGTLSWSTGSTTAAITVNPTATTTYTATCTVNGCTGVATRVITITPPPAAPVLQASSNTICVGDSATITATSCTGSIRWSTGATTASIRVAPTAATTYTATCTVNGCVSPASAGVTITPVSATVLASASPTTVCAGQPSTLTATGCTGTLSWNTGATTATISVSPTTTTTYTVTCTTAQNCQAVSSVTVNVTPAVTPPTIAASRTTICAGDSVTLTASACAGTLSWSTGATTAAITVTPTTTTTYTATCTVNGCTGVATQVITITPPPAAPVLQASSNTICVGDSATITATSCTGSIRWSTGATTASIRVAPTAATTYTATCTVNGCVSPASAGVTITPVSATVLASASPTTVCAGQPSTLTATGCTGTLSWSTGATTATISVSPTTTTTYTVTCTTAQNCRAVSTVTVNVTPAVTPPTIAASRTAICAGDSVTLTASACAGTLSWSTGATTAAITVTPTTTTTYTATCTVNGCTATSDRVITVTPLPLAPIVTCGAERICAGDTLVFTAHNCAGTVTWSTGATGPIAIFRPTVTTTYTATCTVNGCTSPASIPATITVLTPNPRIIASKASICAGDSVRLTVADCAGTIRWNTGALTVSIDVNPTVTTTYTATCTVEGCAATASQVVTVTTSTQPPTITASKTTSCGGEVITLTASTCSGAIQWSTGATTASIQVTPLATTTYTVSCVVNGCRATGSQVISVSPISAPTISANKTGICGPDSVRFTATGCAGGTIRWSTGQTGASLDLLVSSPTTYTATCTQGTCVSGPSNEIAIGIGTTTPPVITSTGTAVCAGSQVTLTAASCAGTVVWSNGLTTASITVSPVTTTTYTALCRVSPTCISAASNAITVNVVAKPLAPKLDCTTATICAGDTVRVSALGCEGLVRWSTGATGPSILVNPSNTLILTATCSIGTCESDPSGPTTISVGIPAPPTISCTNTLICLGGSATLTATGCAGRVVWSTGQIGTSISVSPTAQTTYSAVCRGSSCESQRSNQITIAVSGAALATPRVRNLVNTCPFTTVDLTTAVTSSPSSPNGRFVYRTGSNFDSPIVANPSAVGTGNYFVFETTGSGCSSAGVRIVVAIDQCPGGTPPTGSGSADIQVRILSSRENPVAGDSVLYTIRVRNNGPDVAEDIKVANVLPTGLILVSGSNGLTRQGDSLTTVIDTLGVDQVEEFTYVARFQSDGTVNNDVQVTARGTIDPIPSNNFATVAATCNCVRVAIGAALAIRDTSRVGNCLNVNYLALVKNTGTVNLTNVVLKDTLRTAFAAADTFNLVQAPRLGAGSTLILNPAFNGRTDTRLTLPSSTLAVGKTDTVRYTVRVCPGTTTSFSSQLVADGTGRAESGVDQNVRDLSNNGFNPDAVGDNKTVLNVLPPGTNVQACLGLALSADTLRQNAGTLLVTYRAILLNCGALPITNVSICDTLANTFTAPASATIFGGVQVNAGSALRIDTSFNGTTQRCMLLPGSTIAPGVSDTLVWRVRLVPNASTGPFINQIVANGVTNGSNPISEISNDGRDPRTTGNLPTVINLRPSRPASIGIAKELLGFQALDSTNRRFSMRFRFVVRNYGTSNLTRVQVQDNLSQVFGDSIMLDSVRVTADAGFTVNPLFSGRGELIDLLVDSTSTLPVGTSRNILLTVFINRGSSNETDFENSALASGFVGTTRTEDASTNGANPDPDSNGDPRNNSVPTPIQLIAPLPTFNTLLGIAKEGVVDTVRNADGTFNVRYRVVVRNYSTSTMTNIQLVDNLVTTFERETNFSILVQPVVRQGSSLRVNRAFNGTTVTQMLVADSSSLAAGASDTLQFILRVRNLDASDKIYRNVVTGTGRVGTIAYNDISMSGLNPDPDGDNNPGNNNLATPVTIPGVVVNPGGTVIVADALSPNGDSINDELVITGITEADNMEFRVFNRWGQLIFESENYRRDFPDPTRGWNGVANRGILASEAGVPDGTYYYSLESRTSTKLNGEVRYNFITVAR